jgi:hypothetical protein
MGIDAHCFNFLRYVKKSGKFGLAVTIGRQSLYIPQDLLLATFNTGHTYQKDLYCENLLIKEFGASTVASTDYSDYEGATIIHDMNQPIPSSHYSKFDTVIDAGTLEHVFNAPQALRNCTDICSKSGGQILHILPSNNYCGHGFWQFSPELFYSLYSEERGYRDTEVFLADLADTDNWFKVTRPHSGHRVVVTSSTPVYCLVRTVVCEHVSSEFGEVQQSDYVDVWSGVSEEKRVRKTILSRLAKMFNIRAILRKRKETTLSDVNPWLTKVKISELI